jgi:hypothetical protein
VTVLERYRRIYLRLYDLESPRWTTREREALHRAVTDEIELLWLTGELKLDKPTVEQEVEWGLYFFHENLFDVVPQLYARIEAAFARQFPGESLELPVIFSFGSWIGGDRDGNPYVTSEATRNALWRVAPPRRPSGARPHPTPGICRQISSLPISRPCTRPCRTPGRAHWRNRSWRRCCVRCAAFVSSPPGWMCARTATASARRWPTSTG